MPRQRALSDSIANPDPRPGTPIPLLHPRLTQPPLSLPLLPVTHSLSAHDQLLSTPPSAESKESDSDSGILLNPDNRSSSRSIPTEPSRPSKPINMSYDITKFQNSVRGITFSGYPGEEVDSFLFRFDKIADRWNATPEDKAMALWSTCLKGEAQKWSHLLPQTSMDDYDLLTKELREHFGYHSIQREEAFMNCKQHIGESTISFWRRAEQLKQHLGLPPLTPQQQIMWLWIRLHSPLLSGKKPSDFPDVVALLEHCKWQEMSQQHHHHALRQQPGPLPTFHPYAPPHNPTSTSVYQMYAHQPTSNGHVDAPYTRGVRDYQEEINRAFAEGRDAERGRDTQPTAEPASVDGDLITRIQQIFRGQQRNNTQPSNTNGQGGGQQRGGRGGDRGSAITNKWCANCRMINHDTNECNRRWCDVCQVSNHSTNQCRNPQRYQQQHNAQPPSQATSGLNTSVPPPAIVTTPPSSKPNPPGIGANTTQNTNKPNSNGQGHLERVTAPPQGRTNPINVLFSPPMNSSTEGNTINVLFSTSVNTSTDHLSNTAATPTVGVTEVDDEKASTTPGPQMSGDIPLPSPIFALPTSRESNPLTIHGHIIDDIALKEIVVDTGSGITVISLRAFNMLSPDRRAALQPPDPSFQVQAANNSQLGVRGVTILNITLGDNTDGTQVDMEGPPKLESMEVRDSSLTSHLLIQ